MKNQETLAAWDKCCRNVESNGGQQQDTHKLIRDGLWNAINRARA